MRTLFKNLMKGKMHSTDRYVYYDFSIEEHEKECAKIARQNKQKGITLKETLEMILLTLFEAEITIDKKHRYPIYKITTELNQVRTELQDVRENFEAYVEAEKKGIADKTFEGIDKLKAKLERLQSQSNEQHNYSQSNH